MTQFNQAVVSASPRRTLPLQDVTDDELISYFPVVTVRSVRKSDSGLYLVINDAGEASIVSGAYHN